MCAVGEKKHSLSLSPLHNVRKMLFFSLRQNVIFELSRESSTQRTFIIQNDSQFCRGQAQTWFHHPVRARAALSHAPAVAHMIDPDESVRAQTSPAAEAASRTMCLCVHVRQVG